MNKGLHLFNRAIVKTIKVIGMAFVAIVGILNFSACNSDDDNNTAERIQWYEIMLRGNWCYEEKSDLTVYYRRYELHEDHTAVRYYKSAKRTMITNISGYITYTPWEDITEKTNIGSWEILMDEPSFPQLLIKYDGNVKQYINLVLFDGSPNFKLDGYHLYYNYCDDCLEPTF